MEFFTFYSLSLWIWGATLYLNYYTKTLLYKILYQRILFLFFILRANVLHLCAWLKMIFSFLNIFLEKVFKYYNESIKHK